MSRRWISIGIVLISFFILIPSVVLAVQDGPLQATDTPSVKDAAFTRVIADRITGEEIRSYVSQGCRIQHILKDAVSFDCPSDLVPTLSVREARIFYITDLQADRQTHVDDVWAEGIDGTGVAVAILDTGVDTDHPDLIDSYLPSGSWDCVHNTPNPEDDHGHGTHVAGIITADGYMDTNAKGVAPAADFYMFKVCRADGQCWEDEIYCGVEKAVATGAKVMSMSIGGTAYTTSDCDTDPLAVQINWAVSQGMTAVVAGGNNPAGVSSPGCASGAIAVGAVDSSNAVQWWSGRGPALDIVAPGVNIYSTLMGGGYGRMSGTSMATPHTAGVVALLLQANPSLSTSGITSALYSTADKVSTCYKCTWWAGSTCLMQRSVTCTSDIIGAGVVDAYGAYLQVMGTTPECIVDSDCSDGLYCTGTEICVSGTCRPGTQVTCNDGNSCTDDVCIEESDSCSNVWKACGVPDGCCGPACTAPLDIDCSAPQKCWSGSYYYLYNNPTQAKKFCKCVSGIYGSISYAPSLIKKANAYRYIDTGDNTNWDAISASSKYPIQGVLCPNGTLYPTNEDYTR